MDLTTKTISVVVPDNELCGNNARTQRCKTGLSLREVARRMNVSPMYLSDLERGNRGWTPELVAKFNKATKEDAQ